jgi:hypothetical protein
MRKPQRTLFGKDSTARCSVEVHLDPSHQVKRSTRHEFPPDQEKPRMVQNREMLPSEKRKLNGR